MKTWLITGCSTGFGRELARAVLAHGDQAVITARDVEQIKDIVAGAGDRALALPLDVTRSKQVRTAVQQPRTTSAASTCWSTTRASATSPLWRRAPTRRCIAFPGTGSGG